MNKGTYSYLHPVLNYTVNVFYINSVDEVLNINDFFNLVQGAHDFFKPYNNTIFDKATFNIWDTRRDDTPQTVIDNGIVKQYGIASEAGLTWGYLKRIDLNSRLTGSYNDLKYLLWHEVGHLIDWVTEDNDPNDIIMSEYNRIENAVNGGATSAPVERMAEHILEMLVGSGRGAFLPVQQIKGLYDMLLIWHKVYLFTKSIRALNAKITNVSYRYSDTDLKYFGIYFRAVYSPTQFYDYFADRGGWQEKTFDSNGQFSGWKSIGNF